MAISLLLCVVYEYTGRAKK